MFGRIHKRIDNNRMPILEIYCIFVYVSR